MDSTYAAVVVIQEEMFLVLSEFCFHMQHSIFPRNKVCLQQMNSAERQCNDSSSGS